MIKISNKENIKAEIKEIKSGNNTKVNITIGEKNKNINVNDDGSVTYYGKSMSIKELANELTFEEVKSKIRRGDIKYTTTKSSIEKEMNKQIKEYQSKLNQAKQDLKKLGIDASDINDDKIETMTDSLSIISGIMYDAENQSVNPTANKKVKLFVDEKGNPQSAMSYQEKDDHIYVDLLASAPWNIINMKDSRKMKGAGTNMILESIKESEKLGKNGKVRLYPLPQSSGFYKKLGFENISGESGLTLSSVNANKLKSKINQ